MAIKDHSVPVNMNHIVGSHHIIFMTLDSLRYDVAQQAWAEGLTPNLSKFLPENGWERCHTPGNFTYPAHQAFFSGFLPTPASPGKHPRLFASRFPGATTTVDETFVCEQPNIAEGLAAQGYHTVCIGGVGFFNKTTPLSSTFTDMFIESHWQESFGVTAPDSAQTQINFATEHVKQLVNHQKLFLFINISAIHQPNYFYLDNADHRTRKDSVKSQQAALRYVDSQLPTLFNAIRDSGPLFSIVCSDHGEAYGEDGFHGHRLNHEVVLTVPYTHFVWD